MCPASIEWQRSRPVLERTTREALGSMHLFLNLAGRFQLGTW
jgi:hypothetical protein